MTKFNKGILASAIAASAMLAGAASAATLGYTNQTQITYAKDLFATDSRTIDLPAGYSVHAISASEVGAVTNIAGGDIIEVVVSLGQGANAAKYQSAWTGMQAANLAAGILIGEQLGGAAAGTPLSAIAGYTVNYSAGERELRFTFAAPANGTNPNPGVAPADSFAVRLPTLRLYDLQGALLTNSAINGGISVTNQTALQTVLAGNALFAKSAWGEVVTYAGNTKLTPNKWIDVQRCSATAPARVRFSNAGIHDTGAPVSVGTSCTNAANGTWFNAGTISVAIEEAASNGLNGAAVDSAVNNFDGIGPTVWSLGATRITYTVKGTNLTGFGAGNLWLDTSASCTKQADNFIPLSVNAAGTEAVGSHTMDSPSNATLSAYYSPLTNSTAPVAMNVCFGANGTTEMVPQVLSGAVAFDHRVPALFVNPEVTERALFPLETNVGLYIFQNVNPAGTPSAQSFLRLTNNNAVSCDVVIDAKDDAGKLSGAVKYTLAPHASEQFNSNVLETGVDNQGRAITGKFGDGTGKWYVRVSPECANFTASALNRNSTDGTVTDLTPAKNEVWLTPDELLNP